MAKISITDAAKLVKKDRRTIQRAIKSGKLSVTKSATGMPEIDTAELDRVYKIVTLPQVNATVTNVAMSQYATGEKDKIITLLEAEIKGLQEDKAHYKALFEEERKRFDRLLPAPEDKSAIAKPKQNGFLKKIFNRK